MAERWQQWMPFHIDRFRGSPEVQAMHPCGRIGYLYLLASAWQTDDCTVSADPLDLAALSGLGDELWSVHGPRILRKFVVTGERLTNDVLREQWEDAKTVFDHNRKVKSEAGKIGNAKRWGRTCDKKPSQTDRTCIAQPSQNIATTTGTATTTEEKQNTSRAKAASDPRHDLFKKEFGAYVLSKTGLEFDWNGREAKSLSTYLSGSPKLSLDHWKQILANRARSEVSHGEPLSAWIGKAKSFYNHPLDRFGKPVGQAPATPKKVYL